MVGTYTRKPVIPPEKDPLVNNVSYFDLHVTPVEKTI